MLSPEQNDLITRVGPGTRGRRPAAPLLAAGRAGRRTRRTTGRSSRCGCSAKTWCSSATTRAATACSSAPARIAAPISPSAAWRTAACAAPSTAGCSTSHGKCLETPAEPDDSNLCANIRQKAYPVVEKSGILFAYMGPGEPPEFPHFDCFVAPGTHTFAFKGMIDCNWLQSLEVGIDPAHTSFLHRFFHDEDPADRLRQAVPRHLDRFRHADDEDHARVSAPAHRGRADRLRLPHRHAAPDQRSQHACARHQSDVPECLHHPDEPRDDDHAVARADRRQQALLVRDLHELRRAGEQGRDAPPAARALRAARLHPAQEQEQRLRLRSARAGARRPSRAWAPTSTCTTSGPASRWARSRTARRSTSASPTRRSAPTGACCGRRSRTRQAAASR